MSERLLKFLLAELTTLRIRCKRSTCTGVIEMGVSQLGNLSLSEKCPVCGQMFDFRETIGTVERNYLQELGKVIDKLNAGKNQAIEFVLTEKEEKEEKGK